jgi:hypothetical protein
VQFIQNYVDGQLRATIPDVSVELIYALVESIRVACAYKMRSKILLTRTLDLKFIASKIDLEGSWKSVSIPKLDESEKKEAIHA